MCLAHGHEVERKGFLEENFFGCAAFSHNAYTVRSLLPNYAQVGMARFSKIRINSSAMKDR